MINVSLASWPGMAATDAARFATKEKWEDPVLGELAFSATQICPQNCLKRVDEYMLDQLVKEHPNTQFRFHANVRVLDKPRLNVDLSILSLKDEWFIRFKELVSYLEHIQDGGQGGYSIHAGPKVGGVGKSINMLAGKLAMIEDALGIPVGVEVMYPNAKGRRYALDTWEDYQMLFESGAKYALDLSHVNITREHFGENDTLVQEMLASEQCMEIHLSHNEGDIDEHLPLTDENVWWRPLFERYANPCAAVFYEGNFRKRRA